MAVRAGLRKHWKDSAGLVLVTGAFKYARPPTLFSKLASLGKDPIIVPLDDLAGTGDAEWETAMVKRSAKTGFFGTNHPFQRNATSLYSSKGRAGISPCVCVTD